jgi:hypothetical protein
MGEWISRTETMKKYLKTNWKYWDEKSMQIVKKNEHNKYYHLFVSVNNTLLHVEIHQDVDFLFESLKKIENDRIFKIERIIKEQLKQAALFVNL